MLILPAIDLKDGRCVRLRQGEMDKETLFSDHPEEVAGRWESLGAQFLHIVDSTERLRAGRKMKPQSSGFFNPYPSPSSWAAVSGPSTPSSTILPWV